MRAWFVRCNGETLHNDPRSARYIAGEPPVSPLRAFNYTRECLSGRFVRVGWPGAGDLRDPAWRARAALRYAGEIKDRHLRYLDQFRSIQVDDLVAMPTGSGRYSVHVGKALPPPDAVEGDSGGTGLPTPAYYYFFDVSRGAWFENAHRVSVDWVGDLGGRAGDFHVPEIGGLWLRGFGEIKAGRARLEALVRGHDH